MIDQNGYPGCRLENGEFDGGDTAAILGTLWFFQELSTHGLPFSIAGIPLRHPDTTKWYGRPDRFSRDQLIAVLCGMNESYFPEDLDRLYIAHKRRYFLTAWNTRKNGVMDAPKKMPDFCGPTVWALWLRLLQPRWARLVLWAFDLELLASAIHWRFWRKDRVSRNHMLTSLAAYTYSPTWVSRLVFRLNDWDDLIERWTDHCEAVGEYQTGHLFKSEIERLRRQA